MLNSLVLYDLDSGTPSITSTVMQVNVTDRPDCIPEIWTGFVRTVLAGGDGTSVITIELQTNNDTAATDGWYTLATTTLTAAGTKTEVKDGLRLLNYIRVVVTMAGTAVTSRALHVVLGSNCGFNLTAAA